MLCSIASAIRSGYYKWLNSQSINNDNNDYLIIKDIFDKGRQKLGWRPVQMHLKEDYDITMNHKKIKRIMRENGLIVKIRRRNPYRMIMKKTKDHKTFNNILNRNFKQNKPRQVLCTDITYLHYGQGRKAYLSVIKDIATKEIVSWKLSNNLSMKFVLDTVDDLKDMSISKDESIIHSDQGFHYTNPEYRKKVKTLNLIQSMSRKGNCIDNCPIESFFGHLKDEVNYRQAKTYDELNGMIDEYMDYYNNHRYQWEIKKMTPVQYRNHLMTQVT